MDTKTGMVYAVAWLSSHVGRFSALELPHDVRQLARLITRQRNQGVYHLTEAFYRRALRDYTAQFYNDKISRDDFIDKFTELIEGQFRRAWNQGMRENGLAPERDMKPIYEAEIENRILKEYDFVEPFINDVDRASNDGTPPVSAFDARIDLWAARYNEVVDYARHVTAQQDDLEEWQLGETEQHCKTCAALNGITATIAEWDASGYRPQNAPNELLECGGWRCDCRRQPSDGPATPGGIPKA
jgi:hypothetical protein